MTTCASLQISVTDYNQTYLADAHRQRMVTTGLPVSFGRHSAFGRIAVIFTDSDSTDTDILQAESVIKALDQVERIFRVDQNELPQSIPVEKIAGSIS